VTLAYERRRELVDIAREHRIPILEDDPYGRLRYSGEHLPSIFSLTGGDGSIYMSTVSKTIAPGMRVAWLVMRDPDLFERVLPAKQAADLHSSSLTQRAVYHYAKHPNRVENHVAEMIPVYRRRRDLMLQTLAERMPAGTTWTEPDGGLFLWLRAPEGIDTGALLPRAFARKVAYVPGAPFWVNRDVRNTMRLNFSNATEEKIAIGIGHIADVLREALA